MSGAGGAGYGRPSAAAAPGLWQAGDPGFITPIANVGLQVPGVIQIAAQAIPPPLAANTGHIYSFNVAGISELHYLDSAGVITQLTGAGGILFHSLQNAYDDGVVIATTAPLGAILFNNLIADASSVLDITRTNVIAPGRGVTLTMPVVYAAGDIVGLEITGDGRTVQLANNAYAGQFTDNIAIVDAGGVNLSTFTMNGTDLEVTNATLLGDLDFDTTVQMRFSIATNDQLELTTALLRPTNTSAFDFGDATHVIQDIHQERALFYDPTGAESGSITRTLTEMRFDATSGGAANAWIMGTTNVAILVGGGTEGTWTNGALTLNGANSLNFGAATRSISPNGVDLEITNTTALGDIIINSTVLLDLDIAGANKISIDTSYINLNTGVTQEVTRVNDADYATLVSDWYIAIHTLAANDRTITIPVAQNVLGRVLNIKLEGAPAGQKITISPNGNIEGAATLDLTVANESVSIIYDGVQWEVFG